MARTGRIRVGTSGWVYKHWRGVFYPPDMPTSQWFALYSREFDTVEINNTFYRRVADTVIRDWKAQAPSGFLYAIKAHRVLTHRKKLIDAADFLPRILNPARRLGPHLGPFLYQLPPRRRCNPDRLRGFLQLLPRDLRHVVEFRDRPGTPTKCANCWTSTASVLRPRLARPRVARLGYGPDGLRSVPRTDVRRLPGPIRAGPAAPVRRAHRRAGG